MYHIPVLDKVLKSSLKTYPYYLYKEEQINSLYKSILLLNMRFYSVNQFKKEISFLPKEDQKSLNENIRSNPNLMLNLRGFLYNIIQNNLVKKEDILKSFKEFEVSNNKSYFSTLQNLEIIPFIRNTGVLKDYIQEIKSYPPALPPKEVKKLCVQEVKKITPYLKNYTYKKLRFLATSNVSTLEDLQSSLICDVCNSCYDLQGKYRGLHLTNSIRKTVTNLAINLIYYYTAKSRQQLVATDEGYSSKVVSLNVTNDNGEENSILNLIPSENPSQEIIERKSSLYFIKQRLVEKYGQESTLHRLAQILDNNCQDFVAWYNKQKKGSFKEVIDIQEKEGNKFLFVLQKYFGKTKEEFNTFLINAKPQFIDLR